MDFGSQRSPGQGSIGKAECGVEGGEGLWTDTVISSILGQKDFRMTVSLDLIQHVNRACKTHLEE